MPLWQNLPSPQVIILILHFFCPSGTCGVYEYLTPSWETALSHVVSSAVYAADSAAHNAMPYYCRLLSNSAETVNDNRKHVECPIYPRRPISSLGRLMNGPTSVKPVKQSINQSLMWPWSDLSPTILVNNYIRNANSLLSLCSCYLHNRSALIFHCHPPNYCSIQLPSTPLDRIRVV